MEKAGEQKRAGKMNTTGLQTSLSPSWVWSLNYRAEKGFFFQYYFSSANFIQQNCLCKKKGRCMGDVTVCQTICEPEKTSCEQRFLPQIGPRSALLLGSTPWAHPVAAVPVPWTPHALLQSWFLHEILVPCLKPQRSSAVMTFTNPATPTYFLQQIFKTSSASLAWKHFDVRWLTRPHPSQEETETFLTLRFSIHLYLPLCSSTRRPLAR